MHRWSIRVYYEDTDLAGIVYYANYLRFIERARTEWARELGLDQGRLREEEGIVLAVRRIEADYLGPARFDDILEIRTELAERSGARVTLLQEVWRGRGRLFAARVVLVAVDAGGRARRLPAVLAGPDAPGGTGAKQSPRGRQDGWHPGASWFIHSPQARPDVAAEAAENSFHGNSDRLFDVGALSPRDPRGEDHHDHAGGGLGLVLGHHHRQGDPVPPRPQEAAVFDAAFWSGEPLDALFEQIGPNPKGQSSRIFAAGMIEWRRSHRQDGA
jgi:acyl-CoA thioester hydrolase